MSIANRGRDAARIEREQLQLASVRQWERERQTRVDAYAAMLTHLNEAINAAPYDGGDGTRLGGEIVHLAGKTRGALRRVLDESNPFVK